VDIIGTYLEKLPIFDDYAGTDPTIRNIFVTYTINTLINVLTALVCLRLLASLGFNVVQSVAGVLALLFCTTHLHYTQNMMENNYILLLTLIGFTYQYEWLRTGARRALLIGSAALGMNLIIRLTTGLDLIAAGVFLLMVLWFEAAGKNEFWRKLRHLCENRLPNLFLLHAHRPRLPVSTASAPGPTPMSAIHARTSPARPHPACKIPLGNPLPRGLPRPPHHAGEVHFSVRSADYPDHPGRVFGWKRFNPQMKAYIAAAFFLVLAYICFYARYTVWSGDFAWGDRYVSSAVDLAAFISVPLLLKFKKDLGTFLWATGLFLIVASLLIQLASLAFWLSLEIYQAEDLGIRSWLSGCASKTSSPLPSQNGRMGPQHRRHDLRPLGLPTRHHVEFPAFRAAEDWPSTALGGQRDLALWYAEIRRAGRGTAKATKRFAQR